jgi:RNA polymerase sigma-70 factor (ECF subfamily)
MMFRLLLCPTDLGLSLVHAGLTVCLTEQRAGRMQAGMHPGGIFPRRRVMNAASTMPAWMALLITVPAWICPDGQARAFARPSGSGAAFSFHRMDQPASLSSAEVLLEAIGRGSQLALKRLYEIESRRLYGIALRMVRRPEIAADVLQDSFVQIWQNARSFTPDRGAAAAWLTGIVRFRAIDAVRKLRREVLSGDPTLGDVPIEPDVLERIDADAQATALRRCLQSLDETQRRCILLAFVDGFSHADIAKRLAAPLGSVKSWVRRGLIALKGCLQS